MGVVGCCGPGKNADVGSEKELAPHEAHDTAAFVELMRKLKDQSGLTYRQLQVRATERGDVLARSTLANVLNRNTLPHPEILAAFVRACADDQRVDAWLEARDRIAAGEVPRSGTTARARAVSLHRNSRLAATVSAVLLLATCVWIFVPDGLSHLPAGHGAFVENPYSGEQHSVLPEECPDILTKGDHSLCVQELQRRLQKHGLDLPADAVFGPYTKMRLTAFQVFAGLPVTAIADEATQKALHEKKPKINAWSPERVERRLREVFPEQPESAVRLVRCLSNLDPLWIWGNPDGSRQWGLFQFSDLELLQLRADPATALDPEWSIQHGRAVWERTKSFRHWSCKPRATIPRE